MLRKTQGNIELPNIQALNQTVLEALCLPQQDLNRRLEMLLSVKPNLLMSMAEDMKKVHAVSQFQSSLKQSTFSFVWVSTTS